MSEASHIENLPQDETLREVDPFSTVHPESRYAELELRKARLVHEKDLRLYELRSQWTDSNDPTEEQRNLGILGDQPLQDLTEEDISKLQDYIAQQINMLGKFYDMNPEDEDEDEADERYKHIYNGVLYDNLADPRRNEAAVAALLIRVPNIPYGTLKRVRITAEEQRHSFHAIDAAMDKIEAYLGKSLREHKE